MFMFSKQELRSMHEKASQVSIFFHDEFVKCCSMLFNKVQETKSQVLCFKGKVITSGNIELNRGPVVTQGNNPSTTIAISITWLENIRCLWCG